MMKNKQTRTPRQVIVTAVVLVLLLVLACIACWTASRVPAYHIAVHGTAKRARSTALVAVSMNLLNGFTGLFSLGQAGFMLLGAYTYAILTIPVVRQAFGVLPVL